MDEVKNVDVNIEFNPPVLKPFSRNEVQLKITLKNNSDNILYWGECDINVAPPLSLASDIDLNVGRMRIGILKPKKELSRPAKVYTRLNNYPDNYNLKVVAYFYDEDGAIAERVEKIVSIPCIEERDNNISAVQM